MYLTDAELEEIRKQIIVSSSAGYYNPIIPRLLADVEELRKNLDRAKSLAQGWYEEGYCGESRKECEADFDRAWKRALNPDGRNK